MSKFYEIQLVKESEFIDKMHLVGVMHDNNSTFAKHRLSLLGKSARLLFSLDRVQVLTEQSIQRDRNQVLSDEQLSLLSQKYKGIFSPRYYAISINTHNTSFFDQAVAFSHENVHAYQYLFRLPIDLIFLKSIGFSSKQALDLLTFHYETEAHWLVHQFTPPATWQNFLNEISLKAIKHHEAKFHFSMMTFGVFNYLSNLRIKPQVATVDIPNDNWNPIAPPPAYTARFFSFPVLYNGIQRQLLVDQVDFRYHQKFLKAVEFAYGKLRPNDNEIEFKRDIQKKVLKPLEDNSTAFLLSMSDNEVDWILHSWKQLLLSVQDRPVGSVKMSDYFNSRPEDSDKVKQLSQNIRLGLDLYQQAIVEAQSGNDNSSASQLEIDLPDPNKLP